MDSLYFAYGSNLSRARLAERVASVRVVGPARLPGWRLTCDKLGRDGSGKANIVTAVASEVWGAVYRIDPDDWRVLDRFEGGYERLLVRVHPQAGVPSQDRFLEVQTYASTRLTDDPVPFDWYKRLLLEGASEHGLPGAWLERLAGLPERPDPSRPT